MRCAAIGGSFPECRCLLSAWVGGTARERKAQSAAGPVDQRARSKLCAAAARAGKKTTLFPLRPPPRIMYQDYPGNFDTSSRGSSGSPAHAESYSSGGGGQQVRAGRGAPGGAGRLPLLAPSASTPNLRLFPFLAKLEKYLGVTAVSCGVLFCSAPPLHFFLNKRRVGLKSQRHPLPLFLLNFPEKLMILQVPSGKPVASFRAALPCFSPSSF